MFLTAPALWLALVVVCAVVEATTLGLTAIWFAVGALAGAIAAYSGATVAWQVTIFIVVTAVSLVFTRPLVAKHLKVGGSHTNLDRTIGQNGYVTLAINNDLGEGQVKVTGLEWTARSDDGSVIEVGAHVQVVRIEGVKAIVKKL